MYCVRRSSLFGAQGQIKKMELEGKITYIIIIIITVIQEIFNQDFFVFVIFMVFNFSFLYCKIAF